MNILFSVPRLHTNYSGMIKGLTDQGHTVSVISLDGGNVKTSEGLEFSWYPLSAKKRRFVPDQRTKQLYLPSVSEIKQIIDKENPDLVIARDVMGMNAVVSLICRFKKIKIFFYDQNSEYRNTWNAYVWVLLSRIFISFKHITTTHKNETGIRLRFSDFIDFPIPHHICDRHKYYRDLNSIKKVLIVGKLDEKRKNHEYVIKSIGDKLKKHNIQLSIYGALRIKNSQVYRSLMDLIDEYDLNNYVTIYKNVGISEMKNAYLDHDLYILPSYNEPAAISHLEAMYCGLPVIVTTDNGTSYMLKDGVNGFLINPHDTNSLRHVFENILENPSQLQQLSNNALQTVHESHLPEHFADSLMDIYSSR